MKNTTHIISILILFLWTVSSCDKPEVENPQPHKTVYENKTRTKVTGRVMEYGTLKPMSQCMVVLEESFFAPGSGGGRYYPIDTTYTDEQGYYVYDFKHVPHSDDYFFTYQVKAVQQNYFKGYTEFESGYWERDRDIILDPFAWIKVHVKNVNPFDDNDYLFTASKGGGHYYGLKIDSFESHIGRGNRKVELYWTITKNKIETIHFDSLFLPAHDTVPYEILY